MLLVAVAAVSLGAPARAQTTSGVSTYTYTAWEPTPWSAIEWRSRCDGGPRGVESGPPIRWTVEFRNRSKEHPVSFAYTVAPPETNKRPSATGRHTIKPGGVWGMVAVVDTERCGYGMRTAVSQVRYGVDADSIPYARPDRPN
jgi:hypothetical protein